MASGLASDQSGSRVDAIAGTGPDRLQVAGKADYRVVPRVFEGPYRVYARLGAVALATLVLLVIALAGMAVFSEALHVVSELFDI